MSHSRSTAMQGSPTSSGPMCSLMMLMTGVPYRVMPKPQLPSVAVTRQPTDGQVGRQLARSRLKRG